MKKIFGLILSFVLFSYSGFAQVQATIKMGSTPTSVYIAFKSAVTLTAAKFSTFQFAVGIPTSEAGGVSATVVSLDPLMSYAPLTSTETQGGISYSVFSFSGDGAQSGAGTTFTAGVEYNYAEVFFSGGSGTSNDVRIMQVPGGGSNAQVNFYVANSGTDVTNQVAQFYSSTPANSVNDGAGYGGSSYAKIGNITLPVKFLGFDVAKKNNDAILSWQIENEGNLTDYFEVERSMNGTDFVKLKTTKAKNNGNSSNSYEITDANLTTVRSSGIIYYRIKQVDKDGRFIYSVIKNLRLNVKGLAINVYPNPIKNFANLMVDLEQDGNTIITINDATGKQVRNIQTMLFKGTNNKKIDMSNLSSGTYMLKVQTASEIKTMSVIKGN